MLQLFSRAKDEVITADFTYVATAEVIAQVPYTTQEEVEGAVGVANKAFLDWRRVPPTERVVYLFKLEHLLGEQKNFDSLELDVNIDLPRMQNNI